MTEYEWDHRNRLTDVTFKNNSLVVTKTVSYNYDYLNRRVHREVGSDDSYYVYDGTDVVLEFDGAEGDDVSHRYLHGPAVDQVLAGEQVSSLDTPGDVLWSLSDNLGTVRDLVEYHAGTDATTVANHLEYDTYGNIIRETNAAVDFLYAFTGREWDAEAQLQNNLNRWYDPTIGRWLSEDPIGFLAGDANLYRYVGNAATTARDPLGLYTLSLGGSASGLLVFFGGAASVEVHCGYDPNGGGWSFGLGGTLSVQVGLGLGAGLGVDVTGTSADNVGALQGESEEVGGFGAAGGKLGGGVIGNEDYGGININGGVGGGAGIFKRVNETHLFRNSGPEPPPTNRRQTDSCGGDGRQYLNQKG